MINENFSELDYFFLNDLLTQDERTIRDTVRRFVNDRVLPIIGKHFEEATFPSPLIPKIAELGLLGANLQGYGCPGVGDIAYGLMMQELERGDSGLRSFVSVQSGLVMFPIFQFGSESQKKKWLPELASGKKIGCFGLTEPDSGSDPSSLLTNAKKKGNAFELNGAKMWITNGTVADVAVVWAKLDGEICGFLVEKGTPGFSAPETKDKYSLRASVTSELIFDHCEIPEKNLLPGAKGLKTALACLTQARYGIAWGAIGAAQACFETALRYAKNRTQFGKPIGAFQITQEKLANMATEITKAQLLVYRLGQLKEKGAATFDQVSMAKRNNVAMALDTARVSRGILGANGIMGEYGIMRHMMNLESVLTYEGTHEIHTLIIGERLTGLPAFQ
ncbi:MAG: acyl-CoA dehydrogenase family protein [Candidatus Omnitrophica bacterium]|nr:acyl-CoA dehydrogenase family protein [Candidatus Omnitrophota bacterium]